MWSSVEGPDVVYEVHVRPGRASEVINEVAEEQDDDLVVMATHGRTGLEKFFLGSVTSKGVRTSPSPVFTVRTLEIHERETG
jgi:nucleotide-binding universal stress UspA family protein